MRNILLVGAGGFAGSVLRYLITAGTQKLLRDAFFPWGTLGVNVIGCFLIGLLGGLGGLVTGQEWGYAGGLVLAATVGGLLGSLFDSFLGATVQLIYWCDNCQKDTERQVHRCGTETRRLRGWFWLSNDWVNFSASAFGALVATGIGSWFL